MLEDMVLHVAYRALEHEADEYLTRFLSAADRWQAKEISN